MVYHVRRTSPNFRNGNRHNFFRGTQKILNLGIRGQSRTGYNFHNYVNGRKRWFAFHAARARSTPVRPIRDEIFNFFSEPFFIDPSATIGVTSYEAETHPDPEIKRSLKAVTFTMGAYCRLCSPSMLRLCIVRHYSQKDVIGFSVACAERWIDWRKSSYAYSVRAWLGYQSYTRVTGSKTISARELCIRYLARVFCSFANTFVQITNG